MNMKKLGCIASVLAVSLAGANAATTLADWSFDNGAIGASSSPVPASGFGAASAVGLGSTPNVVSLAGSSAGGPNSWQLTGWSTSAAIGSQGAQFAASTLGYYQIQVSFDVHAQTNSEAGLLVQYSQDGIFWQNASITSAGSAGILATNANPTNGIVVGSYLLLTNSAAALWDNGVTVNLTGVSGVANDPNFAIRIVNAGTGTNCLDTTGAVYNSTNKDRKSVV